MVEARLKINSAIIKRSHKRNQILQNPAFKTENLQMKYDSTILKIYQRR